MKGIFFVFQYDEPFRSYALPIDSGRRNLTFSRPIFRGGVKKFESRFQSLTPHQTCMHICGDTITDG